MSELFPIDVFVDRSLSTPRLSSIISKLDLDIRTVRTAMIKDFREMGILFVEPRASELMIDTMVDSLTNSIKLKNIKHTPSYSSSSVKMVH